jgi:uncharacterized protein YjbI with pentapeptide repeats
MKVVKDHEHGLLLNHFWRGGSHRLAVSCLLFFDFDQPDALLTEQGMHRFLAEELGPERPLDAGMPKPRGEVLLKARCLQLGHEALPECYATVRVGEWVKTLHVFGPRHWVQGPDGLVASQPEPFLAVDLDWSNAFGGPGYAQNPVGLGLAPSSESPDQPWPLPLVESPEALIRSPADRPEPASFAPLDAARPERQAKLGVLDRDWLAQHWPEFPTGMDWSYFNVAPPDQQIDGYFQPGDEIGCGALHPELPVLATRLPALRPRVFVTRMGLREDGSIGEVFVEATPVLDTVWLFPERKRGIAIWRAVLDAADDEASDTRCLYLVTEDAKQPPTPVEERRAALEARLDRSVAPDSAPLADARSVLESAFEEIRDLPLRIDAALARAMGATPAVRSEPEDAAALAADELDQGLTRLARALDGLKDARRADGALKPVLPPRFRKAVTSRLAAAQNELVEALRGGRETAEALRREKDRLWAECSASCANAGVAEPPQRRPAREPERWQTQASAFVADARDRLQESAELKDALRALGLRPATVDFALLGYLPEPTPCDPAVWGPPAAEPLVLPPGLLIPRWRGRLFTGLAVRPFSPGGDPLDLADPSHDINAPGSTHAPLLLGPAPGRPTARVADALEAWRLYQDCREQVAVIACPDPGARYVAASASLVRASRLLVILYAGAAEGFDAEFSAWQRWHARVDPLFLPSGRNLFEAAAQGCDLAAWLDQSLRNLSQAPKACPASPEPSSTVPVIDARRLQTQITERVTGRVSPFLDRLNLEHERYLSEVLKTCEREGLEIPIPPETRSVEGLSGFDLGAIFDEAAAGLDDPEQAAALAERRQRAETLLSAAQNRLDRGAARLADLEQADRLAWAKRLRQGLGLSPLAESKLDRAAVEEALAAGRSLAGANLAGLDLSGLDFSKADLRAVNLCGARLVGTCLDEADLTMLVAEDADFSQASLRSTRLPRAMLIRLRAPNADLSGADLGDARLAKADLEGARLNGARLVGACFMNATLDKADLRDVEARLVVFRETDLRDVNAAGGRFDKALFFDVDLENANFSAVQAKGLTLWCARAHGLRCREANLENLRVGGNSDLGQANFSLANLDRACLFDADMRKANLRDCRLRRALLERCDLSEADLTKIAGRDARIENSKLDNASLRNANLMFGSLRKSSGKNVDGRGGSIYGADMYLAQSKDAWNTAVNQTMSRWDLRVGVELKE